MLLRPRFLASARMCCTWVRELEKEVKFNCGNCAAFANDNEPHPDPHSSTFAPSGHSASLQWRWYSAMVKDSAWSAIVGLKEGERKREGHAVYGM